MTTTPGAPTATGHTDALPCPRVDVVLTPPGGVATVTVNRNSTDGKVPVRAAVRRPVSGGPLIVTDFEAPFGVPLTYSVIAYDVGGVPSTESAVSNTVTLNVATGCPWAIDPSNPSMAMQWTALEWPSREYEREMSPLWPMIADQAIVITGRRRQPASTIEVLTRTAGEALTIRALADTPVIQLRTPTSWVWRGGYFAIGDLTETALYFDPTSADMQWTTELIPTARPDPALFYPVYTWQDVKDFYTSWAALITAKATWLEVQRNPDPGA
jgi:hypothetical protein